ncbi:hypothetical protein M2283_001459 [Streptomyces pseudovenezuelae]|uniref:Uncharacterized protein n=1 Tax=Streptomyces pseudovenezuelae TaxID=67350 RepID=A0ABT6LCZ1_9ACTN|nr:hypothetical protein [Streptomyces pseudovenezuelae]
MRSFRRPATCRTAAVALALALAAAGTAGSTSVSAAEHQGGRPWFTSWAQSQQDLAHRIT